MPAHTNVRTLDPIAKDEPATVLFIKHRFERQIQLNGVELVELVELEQINSQNYLNLTVVFPDPDLRDELERLERLVSSCGEMQNHQQLESSLQRKRV